MKDDLFVKASKVNDALTKVEEGIKSMRTINQDPNTPYNLIEAMAEVIALMIKTARTLA